MRPYSALFAAVVLSSCVSYSVGVNSFRQGSSLPAGARIGVMPSASAVNPLMEQEVREKINRLLRSRGYAVVTPDSADYLLLALYGMGSQQVSGVSAVVAPGSQTTISTPSHGVVATATSSPTLSFVPRLRTEYDRWLVIGIADAAPFRKPSAPGQEVPWVWVGQTFSSGSTSDLRVAIDYLLVPTFEWVGKDTKRQVWVKVRENDGRVKDLRRQ